MKNSGFDRNKLVKGGTDYTIGDLASEAQTGNWKALTELGAAIGDPTLAQRFGGLAKGGGSDISVDQELLAAIQQGTGLSSTIQAAVDKAGSAIGQSEGYLADPTVQNEVLQSYGLNQEMIDWARARNIPPEALIAAAETQTLGGVAGKSVDEYNAIAEQLGLQAADAGAELGKTFSYDKGKIDSLKSAFTNQKSLEKTATAKNKARENERAAIGAAVEKKDAKTLSKALGIDNAKPVSPWGGMMDTALALGINPQDFMAAGRDVTAGDLASDVDRKLWADIGGTFGPQATGGFDLTDPGDEGGAFSFDQNAFQAAIGEAIRAYYRG